ncbi:MAG: UDP-glucose 4-epimerase [Actinomycetota bacterium]|nr:UDP-glucose 4-epimerase [Actinomycetota bacterium]
MRTLVTGGAGFIGSTLVDRLLAEGHAVDVVDDLSGGRLDNLADARADRRNELSIHHIDIRQPEVVDLLARREPEVVFHLADRAGVDPIVDAEVTILGTLRILEGAHAAGARKVVFASSASVYGYVDDNRVPIRESQAQRPVSTHGVAKKAAADYLTAYREMHGVEFTALALGSVYGPRQFVGPVAAFASALLAGRPATIFGDGLQTRDFLYVDDAVDALVRAAERGSGLLVNIGTGRETSVSHLFRTIAEQVGSPGVEPVSGPARAGDVRRSVLDAGRAKIHLGWSSWTVLEEGLADTLRAANR